VRSKTRSDSTQMPARVYLLDANVLIALATPDHTLHSRAVSWFYREMEFATCPITQGALMRFHMRLAERPSIQTAKELLKRIAALPGHHFWPDDATYLDLPVAGLMGHRQITDAYLVLLARHHKGTLVTLDEALAAIHKDTLLI
jgi:uncharacterized protein